MSYNIGPGCQSNCLFFFTEVETKLAGASVSVEPNLLARLALNPVKYLSGASP